MLRLKSERNHSRLLHDGVGRRCTNLHRAAFGRKCYPRLNLGNLVCLFASDLNPHRVCRTLEVVLPKRVDLDGSSDIILYVGVARRNLKRIVGKVELQSTCSHGIGLVESERLKRRNLFNRL